LLERLHGRECLKGFTDENRGGMASLAHGHLLDRLQGEVLLEVVGGEAFLDDHDLIVNLCKADEEITVSGSGVDFVAKLLQCGLDLFEPLRCGEGEQSRLVCGCKKIKLLAHNYFNFTVTSGVAFPFPPGLPIASMIPFMRSEPTLLVISPRALRMLSMPRVTVPRLEQ